MTARAASRVGLVDGMGQARQEVRDGRVERWKSRTWKGDLAEQGSFHSLSEPGQAKNQNCLLSSATPKTLCPDSLRSDWDVVKIFSDAP